MRIIWIIFQNLRLYLHETSSTKSELKGLQCATLDSFQHNHHSNYPRNSSKILMNGCIPLQLPGAWVAEAYYTLILTTKAHAGNVVTSAETPHGTPRFVKAPRIRPQGKYKYCPAACDARTAFAATADSFWAPARGRASTEIRVSHLKRLSCNTNTPYTATWSLSDNRKKLECKFQ